jgi:hypothetical protein
MFDWCLIHGPWSQLKSHIENLAANLEVFWNKATHKSSWNKPSSYGVPHDFENLHINHYLTIVHHQ